MWTILGRSSPTTGGAPLGKVTICHDLLTNPTIVTVSATASRVLIAHGDDVSRPQAIAELASELLAAKLNVERAVLRGEALPTALIYGRTISVSETLAEADAILVKERSICSLTEESLVLIADITQRLHAINAGEVTYLQPLTEPPAPHTRAPPLPLGEPRNARRPSDLASGNSRLRLGMRPAAY